jgi:8-oxo-dGTP diphosphatase
MIEYETEMADQIASKPVAAVRLIVRDDSRRVLLLRRALGTTGGGMWCLPGGKVDYGDTVEQAAERELVEETSLRAVGLRFLFYQDSLPYGPGKMHCINLYFECDAEGEVALNDESIEAAWIGPGDLPQYEITFRHDEALERYWRERNAQS